MARDPHRRGDGVGGAPGPTTPDRRLPQRHPAKGTEALAGWPGFRTRHIRAEGSREVRTAARATGLRFRTGVGSCVLDDYRNAATRYREVACIVQGTRATTVVVGAAPAALWARQARVIRPAIASLRT